MERNLVWKSEKNIKRWKGCVQKEVKLGRQADMKPVANIMY